MNKLVTFLAIVGCFIAFTGCKDNAIVDVNKEITNRNWSYIKKVFIPVKVVDAGKSYNLYMNLRHTADYRYANIFVMIHQRSAGVKPIKERKEFKLAYPDGEWLGSGSGNLYTHQLVFRENYKFPAAGTYVFEFEQNMRDNPLREVRDVGLRVEAVE